MLSRDEGSAPQLTQISEGRPAILLISPVLTDARVWGPFPHAVAAHGGVYVLDWPGHLPGHEAELPTSLVLNDTLDSMRAEGGGPTHFDLAVAVGHDAPAAIHLAVTGRAAGVVLIRPQVAGALQSFRVADDEIEQMSPEHMAALSRAIVDHDPVAYGSAVVAAEKQLSVEVRDQLARIHADHFDVLLQGPDWVHVEENWPEQLSTVAGPVTVLVPAEGSGRGGLTRRVGQLVADTAPHGETIAVDSDSEFPWLTSPQDVEAALVRTLELLDKI